MIYHCLCPVCVQEGLFHDHNPKITETVDEYALGTEEAVLPGMYKEVKVRKCLPLDLVQA